MLKQLHYNRKKIPVPVPIAALGEALQWVEQTLLERDHLLTRVELDGKDMDIEDALGKLAKTVLSPTSKLVIQADSPADLALQTVDALRNATAIIERGIKTIAVAAWQTPPREIPKGLKELQDDLEHNMALLEHALILVREFLPSPKLEVIFQRLEELRVALKMAAASSDWKGVARILVNQLEGRLGELNLELGNVQKDLFDWQLRQVSGRL